MRNLIREIRMSFSFDILNGGNIGIKRRVVCVVLFLTLLNFIFNSVIITEYSRYRKGVFECVTAY